MHAIWSPQGFLSAHRENPLWGCGFVDFAGSTVVHFTGGFTALIATYLLGPRRGRFYDTRGKLLDVANPMPGHSSALQVRLIVSIDLYARCSVFVSYALEFCNRCLGHSSCGLVGMDSVSQHLISSPRLSHWKLTSLLLNSIIDVGSAISITGPDQSSIISISAVNTTLAAASSCASALAANYIIAERRTGEGEFSLKAALNGCLSGLVAITGGCALVETWAAILIGLLAGLVYLITSNLLIRVRIDDAVDAIPGTTNVLYDMQISLINMTYTSRLFFYSSSHEQWSVW